MDAPLPRGATHPLTEKHSRRVRQALELKYSELTALGTDRDVLGVEDDHANTRLFG